ncbi:hypothetical protein N7G274_007065 [Stereocaulon virgatum]|uniref:Uncharacterized protein n=1 Tax=Stereocaulon virgatum TaxID=373712 RepID=A0ABR4A2J3_9LECA
MLGSMILHLLLILLQVATPSLQLTLPTSHDSSLTRNLSPPAPNNASNTIPISPYIYPIPNDPHHRAITFARYTRQLGSRGIGIVLDLATADVNRHQRQEIMGLLARKYAEAISRDQVNLGFYRKGE